jgi:glycosyltransferase involved in cell wall biosynthesis
VYALELCRALAARHHVSVLCAEFDPARAHGQVTWRVHEGLPIIELVNNWVCRTFEETYRPPLIAGRIAHVFRAVQPDVVHVHNLLNLSFDLPAMARSRGIPVVATLHDYALVCPSGGQRLHRADRHVCAEIESDRCVRCFRESPFQAQASFGRLVGGTPAAALLHRSLAAVRRRAPRLVGSILGRATCASGMPVSRADIDERLTAAKRIFQEIDLFVAPSSFMAAEFESLGIPSAKIRVSDYGFAPLAATPPNGHRRDTSPLRIGFAGTLVWHKGVHVLLDAVRGLPAGTFEVSIFGDPDVFPDYTAEIRGLAAGLPVTFRGAFDRQHVADAYRQMDVLVVPSLWLENSPLVIHEAFMCGIPVVGARIGGIADLIDDGRTGLLYEPTSADALRQALRRLVDEPALLGALAASVRDDVVVKPIEQDAREWSETYTALLRPREAVAAT